MIAAQMPDDVSEPRASPSNMKKRKTSTDRDANLFQDPEQFFF
jgi:hypothetical protein